MSIINNTTIAQQQPLAAQVEALTAELAQSAQMENVVVGCAMAVASALCLAINLIVIRAILLDKDLYRLNSYKFMLALGAVDCSQSVVHLITGFFTIQQTTYATWLNQVLGVIVTPSYVFYAILTIVLALNRFVMIYSQELDGLLFSTFGMKCWFFGSAAVAISFSAVLASPWAAILYFPDQFSWAYDDSKPMSKWVQKAEQVIELGGIPVAGLIYTAIFILILYKKKSGIILQQTSSIGELKILIQAFVITAYCTVLNFLWHNSDWILPQTKMAYCALNFMWIGNGAINPLIYFIVNAAIRQRIGVTFGLSSLHHVVPRGMASKFVTGSRRNSPLQNNFVIGIGADQKSINQMQDQRNIRFENGRRLTNSD